MSVDMNMELAALRRMIPAELRAKYFEVYGTLLGPGAGRVG